MTGHTEVLRQKETGCLRIYIYISVGLFIFRCLNLWDEFWWFLSLRVCGLLSSSLLLFPQRFGRYVIQPSSGVCRTREPSRNLELRPLLNPRGAACSDSVTHNWIQVLSIPILLLACSQDLTCNLQMIVSKEALGNNAYNRYAMCPAVQHEFWGLINLMFLFD